MFEPELDEVAARPCRALTVKDLQIIAGRPVEGGPAEGWQVAAMVAVAVAVMSRPSSARVAALLEASALLVSAPAPVVAGALLDLITTQRTFHLADFLAAIARRAGLEEPSEVEDQQKRPKDGGSG